MNFKDKLIDFGASFYYLACIGMGIVTVKSLFDCLHSQEQSTLKTIWIGGLAVLVGLVVAGLLISPIARFNNRRKLPSCPECEKGRLHMGKESIKTAVPGKIGIGHCSIRFVDEKVIGTKGYTRCDKCDYEISQEYRI